MVGLTWHRIQSAPGSEGTDMRRKYPILEFDPDPKAIVSPEGLNLSGDLPEHCVITFFQDVIERLVEEGLLREIAELRSAMGRHPFYELGFEDSHIGLFHPGVGAPLAAALLEEIIAQGCSKFIACGGAGVLDGDIAVGRVLVPVSAVRDEGTSYHYLPPGSEIEPSGEAVGAIERTLKRRNVEYVLTKTWTTDGVYRETPGRIALRRSQGCLTVEMEAAALFAVARFRNAQLGYMLYAGDDVSGDKWDARGWQDRGPVREQLLWLLVQVMVLIR